MGKLDGKVALVTGGARGQGRANALTLARAGASIVACDLCAPLPAVAAPTATQADLEETARLVAGLGRRCLALWADVRDGAALRALAEQAVGALGRIDILVASAGVASFGPAWELSDEMWDETIAVNLTGVWQSCKAVIPHMIAGGRGGAIIITSTTAGLRGLANGAHYAASQHGLVGLMRSLAIELAEHSIRVNSLHPATVSAPMALSEAARAGWAGSPGAAVGDVRPALPPTRLLPQPRVEAEDVANAVLFLASDEARFITGVTLPVDLGALVM